MPRPDDQRELSSGGSVKSRESLPPGVGGPPGLLLRVVRDRRIAFLFVGGLNTVIGALWFLLFDHLLGSRWGGHGHYPALVLTYVAAILCAFVLYRRLVFRVHGHVLRDLARFSSVYVSAFAVNVVLLGLLVDALGWRPFASQCLITFVTTIFSWVGHNRFSFKRPSPGDGSSPGTDRGTDRGTDVDTDRGTDVDTDSGTQTAIAHNHQKG